MSRTVQINKESKSVKVTRNVITVKSNKEPELSTDANTEVKTVKSNRVVIVANSKIRGVDVDTSRFIMHETPTPATDGVEVDFTTTYPYVAGLLEVFLDGLLQIKGVDYSEDDPSAGTFIMTEAPDSDEALRVNYIKG